MMVSSLALLQTAAVVVLLNLGRHASASLFNFTDAARDWPDGWGRTPSDQATINVQLLLSNQNRTEQLGRILQNSISRNQSFAVAEAVRFALLPNSGYNSDDPANAPTYNMLAANIGAATAYAMHNAAQLAYGYYGAAAPAPSTAGGPIIRGGPYPPVVVQPNASDIFYAVALGVVESVGSSCDSRWVCHSMDCNSGQAVLNKRVNRCCSIASPLMRALNRQLTIFGDSNLLPDALSPAVTVQNNYNLGFLERCIWAPASDFLAAADVPASCNVNRSANYMGEVVRMDVNSQTPGAPSVATAADCCAACVADIQCNVWVFCGSTYGCAGCDYKSINYNAAMGDVPSKRFGPYSPGCSLPTDTTVSSFPSGTCTLKYATFTDVPPAFDNPAASSFVSGYLKQHLPRCN